MNPQEAGNYIADIINKNRQSGETNNQVLARLIEELIADSRFWFHENFLLNYDENLLMYEVKHKTLLNKFDTKDLYKE